jgi:hypothetical protein
MESTKRDIWQKRLDEQKLKLQECQKSMGVTSCLGCQKIFDCEIREHYVKAVYESMNKGEGGGFEF